MNCKTIKDFEIYVQNCSIEELLTLSKDCDFAHTNNYFKTDSICNTIYGNICNNTEITKAFAWVACKAILATMCDTVAYEVLHRIANNALKVDDEINWKTNKEEIPKCGSLIVGCINGTIDVFKVTLQPKGITIYSLNEIFLPIDINTIEYWCYIPEIPTDFKMNNYF